MPLHFVFCIHNHQPVGNFGHVLDRAYRECYLPFLEVLERHPRQHLVLHYSGILLDWFAREHPAFLERLGALAAQGRVEFLGGGYYEPLLALLPEWDRAGQIEAMRDFVAGRFGVEVRGLWLAERVWEPDLPRSLAAAGVEYVVLDDHHLKAAGVVEDELTGPFLTGYGESVVKVIGGSERLRYAIPYQEPERTLDLLRELHESRPDEAVLVTMADDGEKFGVWPGTHRLIYEERWLDRFFELLERAGDWLCSSTYSEALQAVPAAPPVYIPMVSYREMSEWTLPAAAAERYNRVRETAAAGETWQIEPFIRGGHWRGFLAKYPESRYRAGRMRHISERIERWRATAPPGTADAERIEEARRELWRGQCNDAYWHGVFGGLYLPFLRAASWEHLGKAEETLDRLEAGGGAGLRAESADFDGDGEKEILLGNASLALVIKPRSGAALELSIRGRNRNLFDSLTRRPEAYHRKLAGRSSQAPGTAQSIHHLEGTRDGRELRPVVYDRYQRMSLVDHLWAGEYTPAMWRDGIPGGELPGTGYASPRWGADGQGLRLELEGTTVSGRAVWKRVSLDAAAAVVNVVLGCGGGAAGRLCLGQEFNLTPTSIDETRVEVENTRGNACTVPPEGGEFAGVTEVRLEDPLGRVTVRIGATTPFNAWIARLATISNSESGYEEVDQQISLLLWREWPDGGEAHLDLAFRVE